MVCVHNIKDSYASFFVLWLTPSPLIKTNLCVRWKLVWPHSAEKPVYTCFSINKLSSWIQHTCHCTIRPTLFVWDLYFLLLLAVWLLIFSSKQHARRKVVIKARCDIRLSKRIHTHTFVQYMPVNIYHTGIGYFGAKLIECQPGFNLGIWPFPCR